VRDRLVSVSSSHVFHFFIGKSSVFAAFKAVGIVGELNMVSNDQILSSQPPTAVCIHRRGNTTHRPHVEDWP